MERKIGEIFKDGDIPLMVIECDANEDACGDCFYLQRKLPCNRNTMKVQGECLGSKRSDDKDVVFICQ